MTGQELIEAIQKFDTSLEIVVEVKGKKMTFDTVEEDVLDVVDTRYPPEKQRQRIPHLTIK